MEQESTKDLVIVRKTIWLVRMINQAWSVGHCKDTIINRMLMTKDRQWTPLGLRLRTASGRCKGHRSRNK
ncbi:hypothetical protein V12G01_22398 [Vibrio alginolyticus 12G01]|nr:hypothetical protein V12G01_22398 [Vibrio alginolyticus 12G01]EGQ8155611.1 hypothetical protein [Vibrio alginolyticus]QCO86866.1 hypothetical protein D3H41_12635 [Vibrio neocaledonicus]EHA1075951.1 hypothetical protein [Vibrio alginolyticus]EHA1134373.1 hypothetical protein [Vibrio alginolyticus]